MATWNTKTGWSTLSLPTNYTTTYTSADFLSDYPNKTAADYSGNYPNKTAADYSGNYPDKTAADYARNYPSRIAADFSGDYPNKTAVDFSGDYPANKETEVSFWTKTSWLKTGPTLQFSWTKPSSKGWDQHTLSSERPIKEQFNSYFRDQLSYAKKLDDVKRKHTELISNAYDNAFDLEERETAAANFNTEQEKNRVSAAANFNNEQEKNRVSAAFNFNAEQERNRLSAAANFNAEQEKNRVSAATNFNTEQEKNRVSAATTQNETNTKIKQKNESLNKWSSDFVNYASNAQAGTYLTTKEKLPITELNDLLSKGVINKDEYNSYLNIAKGSFDNYYQVEKVGAPWDAKALGALDPTGKFNAAEYAEYNPDALKRWNEAVAQGNLDITARYTKDTFLWQDYTSYGKFAGYRASKPVEETTTEAYKYKETLTDLEKQLYRDQVLGITTDATGKQSLVLAAPQYDKEGNLINTDDINTLLERTFANTLSGDDVKREKQLGSLAQDLLRVSIDELKKAKQQEASLSLMSQLPGYNEIMNINSTLANSIMGDSGVGGILGLTGGSKQYQDKLEKDISGLTGISSNSTIYNWQKWFDETLLKRYENYEIEATTYSDEKLKNLQATAKEEIDIYNKDRTLAKPIYLEIAEKYKDGTRTLDVNNAEDFKKIMFYIDKESNTEFVKSFVDGYLKPRFDQSKSMDEFISYLDVKEEEQNIFQSQTTINKLKQIADLRSKTFLDLVQSAEKTSANFNPDFYLDPIANNKKEISPTKLGQYQLQKDLVAQDFENAKNGTIGSDGINWATEAYRYGFENSYKTDPKVFAKLHYQAKGSTGAVKDASGKAILLDPAEDILPYEELAQKIKNFGVEMAARKEFYGGAGFMEFVTPEEFADAVLGSINPEENKDEWEKVLASIGLEGANATVDQVKDYLVQQIQTEEAQNIREGIKYLNEKQEDLNQKTLGVSYIQRPTDVKEVTGERTVLYDVFKNAGYGGTEDEFYSEFFPDVDRTEQQVISKATSGKGLESAFGDMNDPFSAFTSVSSLFGEDDSSVGGAAFVRDREDEDQTASAQSSYFKIFEDDEELPQKSASAASFLSDFTSLFKGFS